MVSAPSQVFRRVQRSPYFPDISMFSHPKTLQTPLRIFPLKKHGFLPPRNRRSCWCPRGLCTLVWMGLPPARTGAIHILIGRIYIYVYTANHTTDRERTGNYFSEEGQTVFQQCTLHCRKASRNWQDRMILKYAEFWQLKGVSIL